ATTSARGGWFGPNGMGPPLFPLDTRVLSNDEAAVYIDALGRNGFTAPDSWYVNLASNAAYAEKAKASWRLMMPVMFVHATYDPICATSNPALTAPMREYCADLSEVTIESGHWVAQEKADDLNAAIRAWLTEKIPAVYV
ncbi:MAG: alpha/beta hydrolase, partial [Pseudomonadota bacterium]